MVLRLGEALGVPLRERNELLRAAGLGAGFPEASLAGPDLAAHRAVLANTANRRLYDRDLVGVNLVRMVLAALAACQIIVNWPQVAWAGLDRLRHQRDQAPFDETLTSLVRPAETALDGVPECCSWPDSEIN